MRARDRDQKRYFVPVPQPPSDSERVRYADANNRLLSVTQLIGWIGLSLALALFALNNGSTWPFLIWVGLGVIYFALSFTANTTFHGFDLAAHDALVAEWRGAAPSVDVFLPNCGEALTILANTFRHVSQLEWDGPVNVYCLDDAGRPEIAAIARQFGFHYLSRPNKGEFKKAGNLRYGYERSCGDFVVIFDADFCPRPDLIRELVPYALADPSIGIVQSPQFFTHDPRKNWLENGAGSVQEFFYRWVMPGRDRRGSPICVGTNAVYRRRALDVTGGGALVYTSEDVHTGFDLMAKGYATKYVPVVLAKGVCPNTLESFFNQQHRWCTGSMSLLFSHKFWQQPIGLRARLTFLSGQAYFIYTGLGLLLMPLPALLMVCAFPEKVFWWNYVLLVPALLQSFVFLPLWHRTPYGLDVARAKLVYSWAHLFAFKDRLTGRPMQWSPTGGPDGHGRSKRVQLVRVLIVAWPLAAFLAILAGSVLHMSSAFDLNFWPPLALSAIYAASALLTLRPLGETVLVIDPAIASQRVALQAPEIEPRVTYAPLTAPATPPSNPDPQPSPA